MRVGYVLGAIASAAAAAGEVVLGRSVLATDPEAALGEFITATLFGIMAVVMVRKAFADDGLPVVPPAALPLHADDALGNTVPGGL